MDITMCKNADCPVNYKCYRYMAKKNSGGWNTYFQEKYTEHKENGCEHFLDMNSMKF